MKQNVILFFCIIFLSVFFPKSILSHPHVFVTSNLGFIFDDKGLSKIQVKWEFDEFFSDLLATDYDTDENNKLDKAEIKVLKSDAFSNLAKFNYFTNIKIDGKPFIVKFIKDFSAELVKGILYYNFTILCHVRAIVTPKQITISQYDTTFYTAVEFAKNNPVALQNDLKYNVKFDLVENKNESFYFEMLHPTEVVLGFSLKR